MKRNEPDFKQTFHSHTVWLYRWESQGFPATSKYATTCQLSHVFTKCSGVIWQKLESRGKKEKSPSEVLWAFSYRRLSSEHRFWEVPSEHIRFSATKWLRAQQERRKKFSSPPPSPLLHLQTRKAFNYKEWGRRSERNHSKALQASVERGIESRTWITNLTVGQ